LTGIGNSSRISKRGGSLNEEEKIKLAYKYPLPSTMRELNLLTETVTTYHINLDNILDVGCGVGHALEALGKLGAKGIGIDLNESVILWLRKKIVDYDFEFCNQDFFDFYPPKPLSLITMLGVLEHQEEDRAFARKAFEILSEGGYLIITVPAHSKQFCLHDSLYGHFRRYDRLPLKDLLQSQGFEVIKFFSYGIQLLQIINSMFIREGKIKDTRSATIQSSFALPSYYVRLYPILRLGVYPYTMLQKLIKNTDIGNCYLVISRKPC